MYLTQRDKPQTLTGRIRHKQMSRLIGALPKIILTMIYELVPSSPSSAPAASTDKSGAGFAKKIDWALLALCCCNAVDAVETLAFSCILNWLHQSWNRD
ncbi:hypothetical protein BASA81_002236 [Batrachochytrium salamandrivorans]|nr:hypothetical protein BASA81_002236 [Batrachochytrium salamandrivorans]